MWHWKYVNSSSDFTIQLKYTIRTGTFYNIRIRLWNPRILFVIRNYAFGIPHILIENPQSPFVTLSSWGTRCIVWELHNYYIHINIWSSFATHDPVSWVYIVVRNLQFQVWNIGTRVWDTRFQFATLGYLPIRTYTRSTEGIHQDPTRKPQAIVPVGMFESNIVNPDICAERWGYSRGSHGELTGNRARWHGWK